MRVFKFRVGPIRLRLSFSNTFNPISIVVVNLSAAFRAAWGLLRATEMAGKMFGAVNARLGGAYAKHVAVNQLLFRYY